MRWRDELVAADPGALIAAVLTEAPPPLPPAPPGQCPPVTRTPNRAINDAVAKSDTTRHYLDISRRQGRPVLTLAMRRAPCLRSQPYLRDQNITSWLLFRAGRFTRDPVSLPAAGPEHPDCPDCGCPVVPEDGSVIDSVCSFHMVLHRIASCGSNAAVCRWYHDVALRIVPTLEMARAITGVRVARVLWRDGDVPAWERGCLPFLEHLLCPSALCPREDPAALKHMLAATRLFLTTVDADLSSLPAVDSFGSVPALPFLPAGELVPEYASASYWDAILRLLPPVPRAPPGHEAEAPWVRSRCRVTRRRGHGVIPD